MRRKYIMSQEDIYAANNVNKSMERNGIVPKVKSVQNNYLKLSWECQLRKIYVKFFISW